MHAIHVHPYIPTSLRPYIHIDPYSHPHIPTSIQARLHEYMLHTGRGREREREREGERERLRGVAPAGACRSRSRSAVCRGSPAPPRRRAWRRQRTSLGAPGSRARRTAPRSIRSAKEHFIYLDFDPNILRICLCKGVGSGSGGFWGHGAVPADGTRDPAPQRQDNKTYQKMAVTEIVIVIARSPPRRPPRAPRRAAPPGTCGGSPRGAGPLGRGGAGRWPPRCWRRAAGRTRRPRPTCPCPPYPCPTQARRAALEPKWLPDLCLWLRLSRSRSSQ